MAIKLIIVGLRRSGTTIFWETFRQDRRLRCYDEPFNPLLLALTGSQLGMIKHPEEFQELLRAEPVAFWERFAPIDPSSELHGQLSDRQVAYLRHLAETGEHVILDTTRCLFKLQALKQQAAQAVLVHLYRPPAANATSHMLPTSANRARTKVRRFLNTRDFWTRNDRYDYWMFERLVGDSPHSLFAHRLREIGLDAQRVYSLPAVGKLLAFWRVHYERAERDGKRLFGERFISQNFDEFTRDPAASMQRIYDAMELKMPPLDFSRIRPAKAPFDADSPKWSEYAKLLELPEL
jgi:hypothetical protein